jgi:crotonobetainyl-CoA:carnitine CoA-transferase CaiB-like acyl-CoA transferase
VSLPMFACCSTPARFANAGRHQERQAMFEDLRKVFIQHTTADLARELTEAKIPWAEVNDIPAVARLEAVSSKLTSTRMPDGREIRLQPLPVDLDNGPRELSFPPSYGEHTRPILSEIGLPSDEIQMLLDSGIALAAANAEQTAKDAS